jgi:O-antigen/teichoic acid export membrane protein
MNEMEIENPQEATPSRKKDSIFDEGFLVVITGLGNVFNFIFHIYMSRNLGPDGYSALNSLLSLLYVLAVPIITIQTTITKFVAQFTAKNEQANVRRLFFDSVKRVSVVGFALMTLIIFGAPLIREFLNIEGNAPVIASGLLVFVMFLMPVIWALLQGREQFGFLGMSYFVNFTAKCGLGIVFAIIGWGVGGVILGVALAFVAGFIVAVWPIREALAPTLEEDTIDMREIYRFALPVVVALFFLSWFCNVDIALVRHFYGETEEGLKLAGYYATASIVGKSFLFLPIGIILALIPKVSRMKAMGENPTPVLLRGIGINVALSAVGIVACLVLAPYLAMFLGKTDAPELVALIRYFGFAITPVATTLILANYNLANEQYRFIWLLAPITVLTFAGIWLFHQTPLTVLTIIAIGGFAMFVAILALTILAHKKNASEPVEEPPA